MFRCVILKGRAANRAPLFSGGLRRPGACPSPVLKRARARGGGSIGPGRPPGSTSGVGAGYGSPRLSASAAPGAVRGGADWGIDDYVYGGPRTHTVIELVRPKDIETPTWHRLPDRNEGTGSGRGRGVGRPGRGRGRALNDVPAAAIQAPIVASTTAGTSSSSEETDDEAYRARHHPYEEQEIRLESVKCVILFLFEHCGI